MKVHAKPVDYLAIYACGSGIFSTSAAVSVLDSSGALDTCTDVIGSSSGSIVALAYTLGVPMSTLHSLTSASVVSTFSDLVRQPLGFITRRSTYRKGVLFAHGGQAIATDRLADWVDAGLVVGVGESAAAAFRWYTRRFYPVVYTPEVTFGDLPGTGFVVATRNATTNSTVEFSKTCTPDRADRRYVHVHGRRAHLPWGHGAEPGRRAL